MSGGRLDAVLHLGNAGHPVLPLGAKKVPRIRSAHPKGDPLRSKCKGECGQDGHGFYDATTDADKLKFWWTKYPDADVGLRTGISCDVLDVDHVEFETGVADLPECVTLGGPVVRTGGGKWHLWFKPTGLGRRIRFSEHCDWLGDGGLAVVPPSTKAGQPYEWFAPLDLPLTDAPAELLAVVNPPPLIAPRPPTPLDSLSAARQGSWSARGLVDKVAAAVDGYRNSTLWWAARKIGLAVYDREIGSDVAVRALDEVATAAERTGLASSAVARTAESGYRTGLQGIRGAVGRAA